MRNRKDSLGKPKKYLFIELDVSILAVGLGYLLVGGNYFGVERETEAYDYAKAETTDNQELHPQTREATAGSALHDGLREVTNQTGVVNAALLETKQDKVYVCPMNCVPLTIVNPLRPNGSMRATRGLLWNLPPAIRGVIMKRIGKILHSP